MGHGPCFLTRVYLTVVAISCVCWRSTHSRPQLNAANWNTTRDWKRELADKEGYFTNTWAVEIDPAEEQVVAKIAKKHGFSIIGQVGMEYSHFPGDVLKSRKGKGNNCLNTFGDLEYHK